MAEQMLADLRARAAPEITLARVQGVAPLGSHRRVLYIYIYIYIYMYTYIYIYILHGLILGSLYL